MRKKRSTLTNNLIAIVLLLVIVNAAILVYAIRLNAEEKEMPKRPTESIAVATAETEIPTEAQIPETQPPTQPQEEETLPEKSRKKQYDQVPLYFQTDYPNNRYGYGTIKDNGCSITSLAMVASYLTSHEYLPDELADYFGGYGENNIQKLEYASEQLQLPWRRAVNVHEVIKALQDGDLAILLMNEQSIFTETQHFIVLTGINDDGLITVHDPYEPNYEKWDLKRAFTTGFKEGDIICGYSGGWIYDVSKMPKEPFIYEEIKPEVEPRYPGIKLTSEEEDLLAKVIWVEARGEPAEGQQAIAEIVFNRIQSKDFPDTVNDVIYAYRQFRSVAFLDEAKASQAQYDAISDALNGPYVLPEDVVHFATYPVNGNVWGQIGGHIFCYQWEAEETKN